MSRWQFRRQVDPVVVWWQCEQRYYSRWTDYEEFCQVAGHQRDRDQSTAGVPVAADSAATASLARVDYDAIFPPMICNLPSAIRNMARLITEKI